MFQNRRVAGALLCLTFSLPPEMPRSGRAPSLALHRMQAGRSHRCRRDGDQYRPPTVSYTTRTNQAGLSPFLTWKMEPYSVAVTKAGFETFTETSVHLDPSETARVAATLRVGSASARVEVTASAVQLQTDSSSVSAGVSAQVIDIIPNITENPFYYTTLQNGVQPRKRNLEQSDAQLVWHRRCRPLRKVFCHRSERRPRL